MKKTLLILCALLLTSIGASAQTPYEFHAEDWVTLDVSRLYQGGDSIVYNADNTITVEPRTDTYEGVNNVALGNSYTQANTAATISTNGYYITSEQTYYVIVGKDLSTATEASKLWWMNGHNDGMNVDPNQTVTLTSGNASGQTLFAWDISSYVTAGADGNITLNGWTGGGLTATGETATISYIGFCTEDEVTAAAESYTFDIPENTYAHACTANVNVWTATLTGSGTLGDFKVDTAEKEDESGMEPPFLTYWVYESGGTTLPDTKITHETIEGLTAGVYEVSMDIRIIDYDEGTVGAGTTFNANSVSQDIKLGVDATEISFNDSGDHDDIYGTYTLYVTVAEGESLTVSLDIKDANYNWIMFKNLKVKSLGTNVTPVTVSGEMQAEYGTLILPFDATITDDTAKGITAYTGTLNEDKDELTLTAVEGGKLTAGTPYIIGGSSGTSYTFSGVPTAYNASNPDEAGLLVGTLVDMKQANGDFTQDGTQYVLQNQENGDGLGFYPITSSSSGVELNAYHCYLTLSSGSSPVRGFISFPSTDDEATAIVAVESEEESADAGAIYDLSGRRVAKAVKGVYIQNGKKVLVK